MTSYRVDVENAAGTSGDSVVIEAEDAERAAELALLHFPGTWVAMESQPATDEDREVCTIIESTAGNAPLVQQMTPDLLTAHEELHSIPTVPAVDPPEAG